MNPLSWLNPAEIQVEILPRGLRVRHRGTVREWDLERTGSGPIREACAGRVAAELAAWLEHKPWQPRRDVLCALPAGGVSLRRVKAPRAEGDELGRVLHLQIEGGFPLGPAELAWGWQTLAVTGDLQEVLLAAVKREVVAEYRALLTACGLNPSFTLGAAARATLAPGGPAAGSFLHFGAEQTEWLVRDDMGPQRLRVLPWGGQSVLRGLVEGTGLTPDLATAILRVGEGPGEGDGVTASVLEAVDAAVDALLAWLPGSSLGARVWLSGDLADSALFRAAFMRRLGGACVVARLEADPPAGESATLRGLARLGSASDRSQVLVLEHRLPEGSTVLARPAPRQWAVAAGVLGLVLLLLPYAEALLLQPGLAAKVASIKKRQDDLRLIDQQSDFLRYLKQNQAPYLDTLTVIGKCTPPGAKIDSFNLNRKGELSLRVTVRQPPEAADFRTKLTDSGLFSSVVIEEQSPAQNRQQFLVRLTAQVKPVAERGVIKLLVPEPLPAGATNKAGITNAPAAVVSSNAPPAAAATKK